MLSSPSWVQVRFRMSHQPDFGISLGFAARRPRRSSSISRSTCRRSCLARTTPERARAPAMSAPAAERPLEPRWTMSKLATLAPHPRVDPPLGNEPQPPAFLPVGAVTIAHVRSNTNHPVVELFRRPDVCSSCHGSWLYPGRFRNDI